MRRYGVRARGQGRARGAAIWAAPESQRRGPGASSLAAGNRGAVGPQHEWRGDRAAEGARLEIVCPGNRTVGSNPTLSAKRERPVGRPGQQGGGSSPADRGRGGDKPRPCGIIEDEDAIYVARGFVPRGFRAGPESSGDVGISEPRQARKGATVGGLPCARGLWAGSLFLAHLPVLARPPCGASARVLKLVRDALPDDRGGAHRPVTGPMTFQTEPQGGGRRLFRSEREMGPSTRPSFFN